MAKYATTWSCVIDKCPAREVLFSNDNTVKPNPPKGLTNLCYLSLSEVMRFTIELT